MERETFEELVRQAVATLPEEIAERMSNVDVEVQEQPTEQQLRSLGVPSGRTLLGLYQGIPLTRRTSGYNPVSPDRLLIFQRPLALTPSGAPDLVKRVRDTVVHEIAHHFGISDERLQEMARERNKRKR